MKPLRLATRGSALARTQSLMVASEITERTGRETELVIIKTIGDQRTDVPLKDVGTIGAFTTEVQNALLEGRADYAVHSLKDLPAAQADGLRCGAIPCRVDTSDWLLVREGDFQEEAEGFLPLKPAAVVGTSSARREAFLKDMMPDATTNLLRGNVPTRLDRLRDGDHDAILLAGAGIRRLEADLSGLQFISLDTLRWPGAPGQGALAIECRHDDKAMIDTLAAIHDISSARTVEAERGLLRALGGGCGLPLGATAILEHGQVRLVAALGRMENDDPSQPLRRADVTATTEQDATSAALAALMDPSLQ